MRPAPPPQARGPQATNELTGVHGHRAELDRLFPHLRRQVVVVAVEGTAWELEAGGELVELVVAHVADQVGPTPAAVGPHGLVDEDRHQAQIFAEQRVPGRRSVPAMSVPLNRISRVVIFGEWFAVQVGTFEVIDMAFTDPAGNPTHAPLGIPAYHFYNDNRDEYYGPLSEIQLVKLTPP
jgi:hypothetical protein